MSRNRIRMCAVAIALVTSFTAAPASAQTFDERVLFTFSGPVELPGVALAPGKYIFRLPNPISTHSVVQVLSGDGMKGRGIRMRQGSAKVIARIVVVGCISAWWVTAIEARAARISEPARNGDATGV